MLDLVGRVKTTSYVPEQPSWIGTHGHNGGIAKDVGDIQNHARFEYNLMRAFIESMGL